MREIDGLNRREYGRGTTENWTPIFYEQTTLHQKKKILPDGDIETSCIKRIQYMIVECESYTIHKSQSKTLPKMGFYITANISQQLLYVGCSRVESLQGLFLILPNATSIRPNIPTAAILRRKNNQLDENAAKNEMKRMRAEAQFVNSFPFAEENYMPDDAGLSLMTLDVQGLGENFIKLQAIESDPGFRHADMIFLTGCGTRNGIKRVNFSTKNHEYQNHYLSTYTGEPNDKPWGTICFIKKEIQEKVKFVASCKQRKSTSEYEWSLHKYEINKTKNLYFCVIHLLNIENATKNLQKILIELHNKLGTNKERIYLFGNFNQDFNKKNKNKTSVEMMKNLKDAGLTKDIPLFQTKTHKDGKQLDWMFTNRENSQVTTSYPVWYSDHAAMHTKIRI